MTLRCLLGRHADGPPLPSSSVLAVRCAECGRISAGIDLAPRYRVTQAGDPHRLAIGQIKRAVAAWKAKHATREAA